MIYIFLYLLLALTLSIWVFIYSRRGSFSGISVFSNGDSSTVIGISLYTKLSFSFDCSWAETLGLSILSDSTERFANSWKCIRIKRRSWNFRPARRVFGMSYSSFQYPSLVSFQMCGILPHQKERTGRERAAFPHHSQRSIGCVGLRSNDERPIRSKPSLSIPFTRSTHKFSATVRPTIETRNLNKIRF